MAPPPADPVRVEVVTADLDDPTHAAAVVELVDEYAAEPFISGRRLDETVRRELVPGLRALPTSVVFLALLDGAPAGVAVCFRGFSTFAAQPILNIHDLAVRSRCRGLGLGRRLLEHVETVGRATGCCKITLEVRMGNVGAKRLYARMGYGPVEPDADADRDGTLFLEKPLGRADGEAHSQ